MTAKRKDLEAYDTLSIDAMNTTFYIAVSNCQMANWKEIMLEWIRYVDREWSRFQPENEVGQVNQLAMGETVTTSPSLFDCLKTAEDYRILTRNLFSPYLKEHMQYHGYTESFPFHRTGVAGTDMPAVYLNHEAPFIFDFPSKTITRIAEGQIDLGGIGKGYAVEAAARWLQTIGDVSSGIVDGGGDLTVWSSSKKVWKIGIAHPYQPEIEIAQLQLKNGSIATSNLVYRSWQHGNESKHHLLNGRTGHPVESGIIQATVVTNNCVNAEVAAKLCFFEHELDMLSTIDSNLRYFLVTKENTLIEGGLPLS